MELHHYIAGQWVPPTRFDVTLNDAALGGVVAQTTQETPDFAALFRAGREANRRLRRLSFHERGRRLKQLALHLLEKKEAFYQLSSATGATRRDSWIDIEGGIGNLFSYASVARKQMPDHCLYAEGETVALSRQGSFQGQHILTPLQGVALHINAFNFPVWGMLEKFAVNFVAGMPAIIKPATATSYLCFAVFKEIIDSQILPPGSLQLICGSARGILDFVDAQDVVTFTGSAATGKKLKKHPRVSEHSVRFNLEADSVNCCLLGPQDGPGTEEFDLLIKEVAREMTVKAGQKCTAIRRLIVPAPLTEAVHQALLQRLERTTIGDPRREEVRMGPLASTAQWQEVQEQCQKLAQFAETLKGPPLRLVGAKAEQGAFMAPQIFYCDQPLANPEIHSIEAFGPVCTIMPYQRTEEAIELANLGQGSLVGSIVSSQDDFIHEVVLGTACQHGRLHLLNRWSAGESTGHGSPLPLLVHGGPGRAGGGEEMGGLRGVFHYMQRTALQGHPTTLTRITQRYQRGAQQLVKERHPFRHYFEELTVGETLHTHKRTITEADIVQFANVSWDHFYAHTDTTSLEGSLFSERVAHGYFIIAAAAGLFVDPGKGPVLANYGLDELRFLKPVYAGSTIEVHLTVQEKTPQDDRPDQIPRGIVKWLVDVRDEEGETVALATILTLVQKRPSATAQEGL